MQHTYCSSQPLFYSDFYSESLRSTPLVFWCRILSSAFTKLTPQVVCLDQRRHVSPFVVSCDGVLGNEAKARHSGSSKRCRKSRQEIRERPIPKPQTSWNQGWVLQLFEESEDHEPNKPISPVVRWSLPQPCPTNTSQNWTKAFR